MILCSITSRENLGQGQDSMEILKSLTPGAASFSPGQLAAVWYKTKDELLYLGEK